MLKVFAVFLDQSRPQLREFLTDLGDDFGSDKVLDWLFRGFVRIDVYVKLGGTRC